MGVLVALDIMVAWLAIAWRVSQGEAMAIVAARRGEAVMYVAWALVIPAAGLFAGLIGWGRRWSVARSAMGVLVATFVAGLCVFVFDGIWAGGW